MQAAENLALVLHAEDRLTKALNLVLALTPMAPRKYAAANGPILFLPPKVAHVKTPNAAHGFASIILPC
jgi:hypothetical protein